MAGRPVLTPDQRDDAAVVLHTNDRSAEGGRARYTVPTAGLYPFQWNWDSGFAAVGWSRIDEDRAWAEMETLLATQWPSGKVAHIVFHVVVPTLSLIHI